MIDSRRMRTALSAILLLAVSHGASAQTFTDVTNLAPVTVGLSFLLTDGTVLCQAYNYKDWYRLTPDNTGSYQNGTWSKAASLSGGYAPDAFASSVLADGRLVIIGGEYNGPEDGTFVFSPRGAVYDPTIDSWTRLEPPAGWAFIGDSPSVVLPNGQFLVGRKFDKQMAALNPATMAWTAVINSGKADFNAEEGWTLMPDGSILTVDVKNHPNSERFTPATATWQSAGSTIVDLQETVGGSIPYGHGLVYFPPGEVGPQILRPDGTVFATGGLHHRAKVAHNAVYHPATGSWTAGPDFPPGESAEDFFAALLPNGNVLVESGYTGNLFEFDGTKLTAEPHAGQVLGMVLLPTGEVLLDGDVLYRSTGAPSPVWAPTIAAFPASVARGGSYTVSGTQLNGLSQANAVGDEYETSTNYPLVRITNNATGHVFYARTHDHSTMGVATGSKLVSTHFDVSKATESGPSTLVVVANGIPSAPVNIRVK